MTSSDSATLKDFDSHQLGAHEELRLFHVYDDKSRTPYRKGQGIRSGCYHRYFAEDRNSIILQGIRKHLDPRNREPTEFVSFYDSWEAAFMERDVRLGEVVQSGHGVKTVRIAEVKLDSKSSLFFFSREELLEMLGARTEDISDIIATTHKGDWFVWGSIGDEDVVSGDVVAQS